MTVLGELQDTSWVRWTDSTTLNWKKSNIELNTGKKLRIAGMIEDSITDGPGLRFAVFTQGCKHNCAGCHNPETHALDGGEEIFLSEILERIDANPLIDGVTLSGGEPFLHAAELAVLCEELNKRELSIMIYTGYTWERLITEPEFLKLVEYCDYVVDGKYEEVHRTLIIPFKGSTNQRIIDVKRSLDDNKVHEIENF